MLKKTASGSSRVSRRRWSEVDAPSDIVSTERYRSKLLQVVACVKLQTIFLVFT